MHHPIHGLYALCDTSLNPSVDHVFLARQLLSGGVSILQLRMKNERNIDKVKRTTQAILALKKEFSFTFILNDFVDLAAELEVDGIHLGQDDMSIPAARHRIGTKLIGYSSHSLEEALTAEAAGTDYVALGAIFPTATKGPGHPVVGLETLRQTVQSLKCPVVAIGGIHRANFSEVMQTGVAAIAMISALTQADDIAAETKYFVGRFNEVRPFCK